MASLVETNVSVVESLRDAWLVEVADVLAADGVRRVERFYLPEDLEFLVPVGVGVIGDRRLHGQQRDDLKQMVLQDVADRADSVVEARLVLRFRTLRPW